MQVRVPGIDIIGCGEARNKKDAQGKAAEMLCNILSKNGMLDPKSLPSVEPQNTSVSVPPMEIAPNFPQKMTSAASGPPRGASNFPQGVPGAANFPPRFQPVQSSEPFSRGGGEREGEREGGRESECPFFTAGPPRPNLPGCLPPPPLSVKAALPPSRPGTSGQGVQWPSNYGGVCVCVCVRVWGVKDQREFENKYEKGKGKER